jgi:hypothetical protein
LSMIACLLFTTIFDSHLFDLHRPSLYFAITYTSMDYYISTCTSMDSCIFASTMFSSLASFCTTYASTTSSSSNSSMNTRSIDVAPCHVRSLACQCYLFLCKNSIADVLVVSIS